MGIPVRVTHHAMSTLFEVLVVNDDPEYARQAAAAIFLEIDRLEGILSHYDACSDIGQINALAAGGSVRVGIEAIECLRLAQRAFAQTGGAFDCTVGQLVTLWRDAGGSGAVPTAEALAAARATTGMERLDLDSEAFAVGLQAGTTAGGIHVDLGGIGKGFALDRVTELLDDWKIDNALIHGGTSTALARGPGEDGQGWPVGVGGAWGGAAGIERLHLRDEALSGSGTEVKGAHIVNPHTGKPAAHHLATWVRCPSAAWADALSTAFMVMSTPQVRAFCRRHPDVKAFVVPVATGILEAVG